MTEQTPSNTQTHAELFGNTSRAIMAALAEFCLGLQPNFTLFEATKIVLGAGVWLMAAAIGKEAAIASVRALLDQIESDPRTKLN